MFDTHCHLNFSRFKKNVRQVIERAQENGIEYIVVPGTDSETSQKAITLAKSNRNVYAAVGIHPHHVYEIVSATYRAIEPTLQIIVGAHIRQNGPSTFGRGVLYTHSTCRGILPRIGRRGNRNGG